MARASADRFLLARAALCVLVLVLFREALAGGVFYERDIHLIWHPQIEGVVRAVAGGAWPLWDPSPAFGQPLLADPGAQVLYPPTVLNLVVRPWTYYTLFAVGHVLFSALAFLALARRWGLSAAAAGTGAVAWTLSGPFLSLVDLWHHFAGVSWLPAVFLCADVALESRRGRDLVLLGLALGLQLLAGSGDASTMTVAALAVYGLVTRAEHGRWRARAAALARLLTAVAIAGLVGAGVWVPAVEAATRSARHSLPSEVRTYWSVHPVSLAETLLLGVPSALPLAAAARTRLFEGREPFLSSLYLGLPCLALAAGAWFSRDRRRTLAFGLVLVGAVLLAVGRHAPLYEPLVALLPPLRTLRYPVKTMTVAAFAWAALVALGTEAWRSRPIQRRCAALALAPAVLATTAALLAAAALLREPASFLGLGLDPAGASRLAPIGRALVIHAALAAAASLVLLLRERRPLVLAGLAGAVALVDLGLAHPWPNPTAPVALYTHRPEILAALGGAPPPRVYVYDYGEPRPDAVWRTSRPDRLSYVPSGWSLSAATALAQQLSLAPQTAGRWGLRQGFDVDYRGLQEEPLAYFTRLPRVVEDDPDALVRLLRLASVTHVVALHDVAAGRLRPAAEAQGLFVAPIRVFAVDGSLPRARVVGAARVARGLDAVKVLLDPAFDGSRELVLEAGEPRDAPPGFAGGARVTGERADRLQVEAELTREGWLLLADSFDEGWRARVDGREAAVLRADLAFRAVALPPGRHRVEMIYRPPHVLVAVLVTFLSLATVVGLLVGTRRRA
jgi:hypothetical protein